VCVGLTRGCIQARKCLDIGMHTGGLSGVCMCVCVCVFVCACTRM